MSWTGFVPSWPLRTGSPDALPPTVERFSSRRATLAQDPPSGSVKAVGEALIVRPAVWTSCG